MNSTGLNFFGQYLLDKRMISREQLNDAISFQEESNRRIGEIACERGYLSKDQTDFIFQEQKRVDRPFGAIALEHRFLTRNQLDDLLFTQTVFSTHLGEALLIKGYISPEQFSDELEQFRKEQQDRQDSLQKMFGNFKERALYEAIVGAVRKAFTRFSARDLKIDNLCCGRELSYELCFETQVRTREKGNMSCEAFMSRNLAAEFIAGFNGNASPCLGRCVNELLAFFKIIESYLCQSCMDLGLNVEDSLSRGEECSGIVKLEDEYLFVQLTTPAGPMILRIAIEHGLDPAPCSEVR